MDAEMEIDSFTELTPIQNFYYGRAVFITGVTGLLGKVLLEKMLRCCPGIGIVYILLRPKKGLSTEERIERIFKKELFKKLASVYPNFRKKVQIVEGDITKERLGICDEQFEKIRQNVSIVIHSAASVNFIDPLKTSVDHNVVATLRVLELCHQLNQIVAYVHVSTSYVKREDDGYVLEQVPKCKITPEQLLNALEWMDEKSQDAVSNFLLENKLTTYLVTKALAENLVQNKRGEIPTAIVRPCYIAPTYKDPFPGWVDSLQGLSGLLLAGAKGVLRCLLSVEELKLQVIPVDIAANTAIASGWHVGTEKPPSMYILNCVMDYEKLPYANQEILDFALKKREEYPLTQIYRYPDFTIYYNEYAYYVHSFFDEWIPAVLVDLFLYIFTGKTILLNIYRKIGILYGIFYRLGRQPWICKRDNMVALTKKLSPEDSEIFFMDTDNFDWPFYMENCLKGGRIFLAHEDPSNIPYARKKLKIWYFVTTTLKWCIILYFFYFLFCRFFASSNEIDSVSL